MIRKLNIVLLFIVTVLTVMYTGTTVQAMPVTIRPVQAPHTVWSELPLEAQMAVIDQARPDPIVLPVQYLAPPRRAAVTPGVEQWRSLVATYFPPGAVEWALAIMSCESGGDPNAYNPSGASGLFQHMRQFWADRSARAGWVGADIFDPTANVAVAAWLYADGGGKSHWVCKA